MANNLTVQMLAAAVMAVTLALLFGDPSWTTSGNTIYDIIALIKTTFLAALRMLIAPMIFFSLIAGISNISEAASLKRLGGYTVSYYLVTTLIAISIGLFVVFFVHPWTAHPPTLESTLTFAPERMIDPGSDSIIAILQKLALMAFANPISSLASLNIVGIVTSAVLFGLAMVICLPASSPLFQLVKDINALIMKILSWVIALLPIGIFAIIFDFTL
ncbi:MAG: dicarboxylate/amino acid:cation symporter, partial [Gammaproteobacteria bacterium]|nr:dicarboxylate/amino acid:cation symporter [Gammaproteobacteria bacterium]